MCDQVPFNVKIMKIKKIKANALKVGKTYYMSLYSNKDKKIEVLVKSKPDCQIKSMTDDDRIVLESSTDKIEFYRSQSHPFFLLTVYDGRKERAIFYENVE